MVEHASIRLHIRSIREKESDSIFELDDFVRNCHAQVEDVIVFPKLKEMLSSRSEAGELVKSLSRLEADHKLIDKIAEQLKIATSHGDIDLVRKRIMLYVNTVEIHNSSEETVIFPYWKTTGEAEERKLGLEARKIIEEYGRDRYLKITGISEKLFELLAS